jgi:hypothetical protein
MTHTAWLKIMGKPTLPFKPSESTVQPHAAQPRLILNIFDISGEEQE